MKRIEPFAMIESRILLTEELTIHEKMIYCVLYCFADNKIGTCYPSYDTIAEKAGCSKRTAIECIASLVEKGYIQKTERISRKGGNRTNLYFLCSRDAEGGPNDERTTQFDEQDAQPDAFDILSDARDTPELYSDNYTFSNYTQSINSSYENRLEELKKRIEYCCFEDYCPDKMGFIDSLCVYILGPYDEVLPQDKRLLDKVTGMEIIGFLDHVSGKSYAGVKNKKGSFKKMFLEYLREEELLLATARAFG